MHFFKVICMRRCIVSSFSVTNSLYSSLVSQGHFAHALMYARSRMSLSWFRSRRQCAKLLSDLASHFRRFSSLSRHRPNEYTSRHMSWLSCACCFCTLFKVMPNFTIRLADCFKMNHRWLLRLPRQDTQGTWGVVRAYPVVSYVFRVKMCQMVLSEKPHCS